MYEVPDDSTEGPTIIVESVNGADCSGTASGSIDITVAGIDPFEYAWTGPNGFSANTGDIENLEAGDYVLVVTDANGNTSTISETIDDGSALMANTIQDSNQTNNGSCDGALSAFGTNGTEPYTYMWSTGESGSMISDLCAGTYTVTITDANGCTDIGTNEITDLPFAAVFDVQADITCFGECDGVAVINLTGNWAEPVQYLWSDGQTGNAVADLCADATVTIIDATGITLSTLSVPYNNNPEAISVTADISNSLAEANGSIELFVSGGTGDYVFNWSSGLPNSNEVTDLSPGTYQVLIIDENGCEYLETYEVKGNVDDCLQARKVISPNADGMNDEFILTCAADYDNTLEIYNRWGQLVYETTNYDNTWLGTFIDNTPLPQGGYFFVYEYIDTADGVTKQVRGAITVLRE